MVSGDTSNTRFDRPLLLSLVEFARSYGADPNGEWNLPNLQTHLHDPVTFTEAVLSSLDTFLTGFLNSAAGSPFQSLISWRGAYGEREEHFSFISSAYPDNETARAHLLELANAFSNFQAGTTLEDKFQPLQSDLDQSQWSQGTTRRMIRLLSEAPIEKSNLIFNFFAKNMEKLIDNEWWTLAETRLLLASLGRFVESSMPDAMEKFFKTLISHEPVVDTAAIHFIAVGGYEIKQSGTPSVPFRLALFKMLIQGGRLNQDVLIQLLEDQRSYPVLLNANIMPALIEQGLWTHESIDALLNLQAIQGWANEIRNLLPLWKEAGLWKTHHSQRLRQLFRWRTRRLYSPAERTWARFVFQQIDEWGRYGEEYAEQLDLFLLTAHYLTDHAQVSRYKHLLDRLPDVRKETFNWEPGDTLGAIAVIAGGKWRGQELMREASLPVPAGNVIGTGAWGALRKDKQRAMELLRKKIQSVEEQSGKTYGRGPAPLLVSVRSGMALSFPGMMSSVLNVGMNDTVYQSLAEAYGSDFADTAKLKFLLSFLNVVHGVPEETLGESLFLVDEPQAQILALENFLQTIQISIPDDAHEQLFQAHEAVWRSWEEAMKTEGVSLSLMHAMSNSELAELGLLPGALPFNPEKIAPLQTAIVLNEMRFGDLLQDGLESGAGIAHSRLSSTGTLAIEVEYRAGSQGSSVATPSENETNRHPLPPSILKQLEIDLRTMERALGKAVEVEFVVEAGDLYYPQVRKLRSSPLVNYRLITDMEREGILKEKRATILRERLPEQIPRVSLPNGQQALVQAISSNGFDFSGHLVFSVEEAKTRTAAGDSVIIVVQRMISSHSVAELPLGQFAILMDDEKVPGQGKSHMFSDLRNRQIPFVHVRGMQWQGDKSFVLGGESIGEGSPITFSSDGRIYVGQHSVTEVPIYTAAQELVRRELSQYSAQASLDLLNPKAHEEYTREALELRLQSFRALLGHLISSLDWIGFPDSKRESLNQASHFLNSLSPQYDRYASEQSVQIYLEFQNLVRCIQGLAQIRNHSDAAKCLESLEASLQRLSALIHSDPNSFPQGSPNGESGPGPSPEGGGASLHPHFSPENSFSYAHLLAWQVDAMYEGSNLTALLKILEATDHYRPNAGLQFIVEELPTLLAQMAMLQGTHIFVSEDLIRERLEIAAQEIHSNEAHNTVRNISSHTTGSSTVSDVNARSRGLSVGRTLPALP